MKSNANNITQSLSEIIAASRFLMIYGLVVHHIFTIPNTLSFPRQGMSEYSYFLPEAIGAFFHMAFMTAVPMLSVISGYLFFSAGNFNYLDVMKKKFKTIALPAWLWCSLWLLVAFGLYFVGHERGMFEWANYSFDEFSFMTLLNGVVGITDHPFAFQFWFVHDLILAFLIFPLIKYLLDNLGIIFLLGCFLFWFLGFGLPVFFSSNVLFFFVVGAYIAHPGNKLVLELLFWPPVFIRYLVLFLFVIFLLGRSLTFVFFDEGSMIANFLRTDKFLLMLRVFGVLGFAQILYLLSVNFKSCFNFLRDKSGYAFLIFAIHYPVIEILKIAASRIPGQASAFGAFLSWLLIPMLTVSICIFFSWLLCRTFPKLFALLNGSRVIK